jgi:hypothetical protein
MPPKLKTPVAAAATTAATKIITSTPAKIVLFHLDMRDAAMIAYYSDGGVDYAEVEMHVTGAVPPGTYRFALAEDGMSISWQRGIDKRCLDKGRFKGVMGRKYSSSSSRVVAYSNVMQAMHQSKVSPDAVGQYWGAPQVIRLTEKCTGTPLESIYHYRTPFKVEGHHQYNTLLHCRVQLAVQRYSNAAPTHSRVIDLFGIQSSQESCESYEPKQHSRKGGGGGGRGGGGKRAKLKSHYEEEEEEEDGGRKGCISSPDAC